MTKEKVEEIRAAWQQSMPEAERNGRTDIRDLLAYIDSIEPMEMGLCEQDHVILKPDHPYIFKVMPGCDNCARIAALSVPS